MTNQPKPQQAEAKPLAPATGSENPSDPPGYTFYDNRSRRMMRLVSDGEWKGWIIYKHPDGQWVSFRKATDLDWKALAAAMSSGATDWKEATEAAEAWCKITDEEGRNHAIYCFRAGYLKAKRTADHGDKSSPASWSKTPPTGPGYFWSRSHGGKPVIAWYTADGVRMSCDQTVIVLDSDEGRDWMATQAVEFWPEPVVFTGKPMNQLLQRRGGRMTALDAINRLMAEDWAHASYPGATVFVKGAAGRVVMPDGRTGDVVWDDEPNAEVSEGGTRDSRIETAAQSRPSLH